MHFGEIVQKLLAHDDAAGTYKLSDVAARSQGGSRRSGHASSVDRIQNSLASIAGYVVGNWIIIMYCSLLFER